MIPARTLLGVAFVGLIWATSGCTSSYSGAAIQGSVVDEETQEPLGGVAVVAEWLLEGRPLHPDTVGRLMLIEAITDSNGKYEIPAWGPVTAQKGHLQRGSPRLNFYKLGYAFKSVSNGGQLAPYIGLPDPLLSEWDGKTVALAPYRNAPDKLGFFTELGNAPRLLRREIDQCAWRRMPRMTAMLLMRAAEYETQGVSHGLPKGAQLHADGKCNDPGRSGENDK